MTKPRLLRLTVGLGFAVCLAGFAAVGWHRRSFASPQEPAANSLDSKPRFVVGFGHVDVEQGIIALYPTQPGRVIERLVQENEDVEKDRVLLRVDDTLPRQRLREAEAVLAEARSQLTEIQKLPEQHQAKIEQQQAAILAYEHRVQAAAHQRELAKYRAEKKMLNVLEAKAAEEDASALQALLQAERLKLRDLTLIDPQAAVQRAEKEVEAKSARRDQAAYFVEECEIRAPCRGRVLRMRANVGDYLAPLPGRPAVDFCPDGPRIIRGEIDQENAGRIGNPADAPIDVEIADDCHSGAVWKGRVTRLSDWYSQRRSTTLDPLQFNDVRTLECIIEVSPGDKPLRIGQRVRVKIAVQNQ